MKYYYSPLFITSSLLLLYSLYLAAESFLNPQSWSLLVAVPLFLIAATGIIVHFLFARIMKGQARVQFFVEVALLGSALLLLLRR